MRFSCQGFSQHVPRPVAFCSRLGELTCFKKGVRHDWRGKQVLNQGKQWRLGGRILDFSLSAMGRFCADE